MADLLGAHANKHVLSSQPISLNYRYCLVGLKIKPAQENPLLLSWPIYQEAKSIRGQQVKVLFSQGLGYETSC